MGSVKQRATVRCAAFLRGVMPTNARMADLRRAFERAGFKDVRTVLGSGNVLFTAPPLPGTALERAAEAAMMRHLGRAFPTIVRRVDALRRLVAADPFKGIRLPPGSRRVVTFLRGRPSARLSLPVERDGSCILHRVGGEVFSAYVPGPRGAVFMTLIEETLGKDVTTRTWETVTKVAAAGDAGARAAASR
jgi:uncharacterized protein (DUF1697 family)